MYFNAGHTPNSKSAYLVFLFVVCVGGGGLLLFFVGFFICFVCLFLFVFVVVFCRFMFYLSIFSGITGGGGVFFGGS